MIRRYRIYFNRMAEWPQVWSVDEGDATTEINVIGVKTFVACTTGIGDRKAVGSDDAPCAWLECRGVLKINCGIAEIVER